MDPFDVAEYANALAAASPGVREIYMLGSRANGTAREDSDWDLLIIGNEQTLRFLRTATHLHRADIDCLVATNEEFENAWGEKLKTGSLPGWKWERLNDFFAEYTENKWSETENGGDVVSRRRRAVQLWPKDARAL